MAKNTKHRQAVMYQLKAHGGEMLSAKEIFLHLQKQGEELWLSTVYRILETLEQEGEVEKTILPGAAPTARYALSAKTHRHYLICLSCKRRVSLHFCPVEELEQAAKKEAGFHITAHHIELFGYCAECQNSKEKQKSLSG